jgi:predicted metal-dependent hydrolase
MSRALRQLRLAFDVSRLPEHSGRTHRIRLEGGILGYQLVRARRRTIALFVDGDGVEARVPRYATLADVEAFIREKERWIRRRLAEPRRRPFVWEAGARLPWMGRTLELALLPGEFTVRLSGERLNVGLDVGLTAGTGLRERVLGWIRAQALALFQQRVAALSRPLGLAVTGVGLSNARTRWGSCSARGRVLLNWRLMLFPPHLIDYVVAHELAHRRELNHSARFWNWVAALYPEHRAARRELNALARTLPEL